MTITNDQLKIEVSNLKKQLEQKTHLAMDVQLHNGIKTINNHEGLEATGDIQLCSRMKGIRATLADLRSELKEAKISLEASSESTQSCTHQRG